MTCRKSQPPGYASCTREEGHDGPCAVPLLESKQGFRIFCSTGVYLVIAIGITLVGIGKGYSWPLAVGWGMLWPAVLLVILLWISIF